MKWVTAGVTFVNLSVVCGLFLGLAGRGLTTLSAAVALVCGVAFAIAAFLGTRDSAVQKKAIGSPGIGTTSLENLRSWKKRRMQVFRQR